MEITSQEQAKQVIAGIRSGDYGSDVSAEREEAMAALRAYRDSTLGSPPVPENGADDVVSDVEGPTSSVARGLGLGVRHPIQGVAGMAGIVSDPFAYLLNLGLEATGAPEQYRFSPLREATSEVLTRAGLPKPESPSERISGAIVEGGAAGLSTMGLGLTPAIVSRAPFISRILAHPFEFFGGAAGGGGASVAKERGYGPTGQIVSGLGSAMAVPTVAGVIQAIRRGVGAFTASGQSARVGEELVETATNPQAAIRALEDTAGEVVYHPISGHPTVRGAGEVVPGSVPTTGVAAGDVGLVAAEAGKRSVFAHLFGPRTSQQNAARRAYLESQIEELGDAEALRVARNNETAAAREAAFSNEGLADLAPVIQHIDNVLKSPTGEGAAIKPALTWIKGRLAEISPEPRRLYQLRKDIRNLIKGKGPEGTTGWKQADRELHEVIAVLDNAIEKAAPGFKEYIAEYSRLSRIADQSERVTEILIKSSQRTGTDAITGQEMISQAKFKNLISGERARTGIRRVLTDEQLNVLDRIAADLDRGMSWMSPVVRAPGTTTPRDTLGNAMGAILQGTIGQSAKMRLLLKPLGWIKSLSKGKQQDLMMEAMLDPKLAAQLMRDATYMDAQRLSRALYEKFLSLTAGASMAIAAEE